MTDPRILKIVDVLRRDFQPTRLFLYGSRANGTNRSESDYDFLMVLPNFEGARLEVMRNLASLFRRLYDVEVQVWIYSQHEFDLKKDDFNSLPETAMNTGKEIELV